MRKVIAIVIVGACGFGLTGCFSQAAKNAPNDTILDCHVLTGQGAGSTLQTDKATAVQQGWGQDSNDDVYCDVAHVG